VVALAPAGGWAKGDELQGGRSSFFPELQQQVKQVAPTPSGSCETPEGKRRATLFTTVNYEHIPAELLAHQTRAVAGCEGVVPMTEYAMREGYDLDARGSRPRADGVGDRGQAAAVADGRDPLPRGLAAERRVRGARRRRPLAAARRPARTAQLILGFTQP
jgi:hypothetical protein